MTCLCLCAHVMTFLSVFVRVCVRARTLTVTVCVGSNVMRSIHGVGELMTQVVLRGGGFIPSTPASAPDGETAKSQVEPEKQDILVMDTKLKIIEILQVRQENIPSGARPLETSLTPR